MLVYPHHGAMHQSIQNIYMARWSLLPRTITGIDEPLTCGISEHLLSSLLGACVRTHFPHGTGHYQDGQLVSTVSWNDSSHTVGRKDPNREQQPTTGVKISRIPR